MRVVRGPDFDPSARLGDPMQLLHGADDVRQVLDRIPEDNPVKAARLKRPGEPLHVMDRVYVRVRSDIDAAARARIARIPAAHIEDFHRAGYCREGLPRAQGFIA